MVIQSDRQTQTKTDNPPPQQGAYAGRSWSSCLRCLSSAAAKIPPIPKRAECRPSRLSVAARLLAASWCFGLEIPKAVSRGPHAGKETTAPLCDLTGIPTYSPPRFVCRGSRGRQGLNVDPPPPPSHRHRSSSYVMFWSQGRELLCFFSSIVKQLRSFPLLHGASFGNPPNHILIIHRYITTSHARGGTRGSRESPSASE